MQSKIALARPVLLISLVGITSSSLIIFFLNLVLPAQDSYAQSDVSSQSHPTQNLVEAASVTFIEEIALEDVTAAPIRIKIPKINVDALIEHVGLTSDGAMDVPKERANVGWFHLGLRPGENGSAVMAGHYGWENKEGSVFDNLYKLRKGDKIYIEDDQGAVISFVVRKSRRYDPEADASGVFGSYDGKAHLNLITCEGAWDKVSKTYSQRLVVFADKEE